MKAAINFIFSLLLLCLFAKLSLECGPGPSFSRRKILKPMVLYQRLPDVDEESIGGSGMFRRIVTENSKEYKELVRNYNKDIVFESGDGKRIMTKRCREKLDKLAKLVKHEWPNVKLRVIEAYDKYGQHPPNSLHYEARAVDITTSDRDKSKIGNLGSLAYQAGFDWVSYESNSYIHASVVSENEVSLKQADCFPSSAKAYSWEHGPIELEKLKVGDHILTKKYINGHFQEFYTEVLGFLDYVLDINKPYLVFKTEAGHSFAATKSHLIYTISRKSSINQESFTIAENNFGMKTLHHINFDLPGNTIRKKCEFVFAYSGIESASVDKMDMSLKKSVPEKVIDIKPAYSLSIGEEIIVLSNTSTYTTKITGITIETRQGAVAPLTEEGSFMVNNILASCYAKINDAKLAHIVFMPYRYIATFLSFHARQHLLDWYVNFLREFNGMFGIVMLY